MTHAEIAQIVRTAHLEIFGAFYPEVSDGLPADIATLLLLGPHEPGFWDHVTAAPEFMDDRPDALDRWSSRVIGRIACDLGGKAYFPFGGPPYHPFIAWAHRSGRAWPSEVGILVHDTAGLMVSYRGAVALKERLDLPPAESRPCDTCYEKPCLTACPVVALTQRGYDIPACKDYLLTKDGQDCMDFGCAVRRACPAGKGYGRLPEQSAYHMRHFSR